MLAKRFEHILHDLGMAGLEHPFSHLLIPLSLTCPMCGTMNYDVDFDATDGWTK